jgi:hypothetical protein
MDAQWLQGFLTVSIVVVLTGACVGVEGPDDPESDIDSNGEALARRGPHCGCFDGDDSDCRDVRVHQWACSYGWPCNFVVYKPDCSYANACPPTTWNGCPLQSQICEDTGLRCDGSCSDGSDCYIQDAPPPYEPATPAEPL